MEKYILPPKAPSLAESMRDIGYSLETAVADIIDNSISSAATTIEICFDINSDQPVLGILDNGKGLSRDALIEAMRHGSSSPRLPRSRSDLGRFGLGLKTASFSQCRQLTVISKINNEQPVGACWDLDTITAENEWILGILTKDEILNCPFIDKLNKNGTLVLWQKLDRLNEGDTSNTKKEIFLEKMETTEKHLAIVFHRYLSGENRNTKINIYLNRHPVEPFDPFCLNNKATQLLPEEIVRISGEEIKIQPYILPHHSKLTPKEADFYQNRSDFVSNQGVYIYRNARLIAWGNWFRLIPKSEATKLARVRIDFPNVLDDYWTIDIKKSRAQPPLQVREKMKIILKRIVEQSTRVHSGRGQKLFNEESVPVWHRFANHNRVYYGVNREHPLLAAYEKLLTKDQIHHFQTILQIIEDSIPIEAIYSDFSMTPQHFNVTIELKEIIARVNAFFEILCIQNSMDRMTFWETIRHLKPFNCYSNEIQTYIKEKFDAENLEH